ncbi:hypothetical protein KP509_30G029400 [Ceratopteris richardii]|nr:hypothetical protein KP509_30G029400 [Ceratopteris richardii]
MLKCRRSQPGTSTAEAWNPVKLKHFAYRELKAATQGFSSHLKLGQGGFGAVYKGILKEGQEVAVKKLDTVSLQGEREFQNELSVIGHVCSSPYVVPLVGFCSNGKHRLLVYEYMPSHSLQEALFDEDYPSQLNWEQRFNIIVDTCKALVFLHACKPPIIHGDIKPSNVLLDANFRAKVADFGLASFKATTINTERECSFHATVSMQDQNLRTHRTLENQRKCRKEALMTLKSSTACMEKQKMQKEPEQTNSESNARRSTSTLFTTSPESDGSSSLIGKLACESLQASTDGNISLNFDNQLSDSDVIISVQPLARGEDKIQRPVGELSMQVNDEVSGISSIQENLTEVENKMKTLELVKANANHDSAIVFPKESCTYQRGAFDGDWWWRQERSEELNAKSYVIEWMRHDGGSKTDFCGSFNTDQVVGEAGACQESGGRVLFIGSQRTCEHPKSLHQPLSCLKVDKYIHGCSNAVEHGDGMEGGIQQNTNDDTVTKKSCNKKSDAKLTTSNMCNSWRSASFEWWRYDRSEKAFTSGSGPAKERPRSREWWKDEDAAGSKERKALKKKSKHPLTKEESSGEMSSRRVTSTPSMRGTLCYIAPENSYAGVMSEKSDVYSFGVLLLVIISGRRPLQVMASPISHFERANLTSWARRLARSGEILELVDPSLQGKFCKKQAILSIKVALSCLQKLASKRPSMADVLKMLSGELDAPSLQFHSSSSPPCGLFCRSRKCSSLSSGSSSTDFTFSC